MNVAATSLLSASESSGGWQFAAAGAWVAGHAEQIAKAIDVLDPSVCAKPASLDLRSVDQLDTYGAWLIESLVRRWRAQGQDLRVVGLPERFAGLVDAVRRAGSEPPPAAIPQNRALAGLVRFGQAASEAGRDIVVLLDTLGAAGHALVRVILRRGTFRITPTVYHLDRVGWQAVPIILLITFLIGCIIAQQGFFHFRKFGADEYVVDMVGILVLREIGVLIVAIMVAGRSGSSYTAELGSMKMREEIDALRTMGLDPVEVLILPRVIALLIALPVLTFLGSMSALYGGCLVAWGYGDMAPDIFITRLKEAISITHFKVGMIKAPFMALVIGIVAASEGLKVRGSAESLGRQTTTSVVKSIFFVIVLDGLFAIFFASIGI